MNLTEILVTGLALLGGFFIFVAGFGTWRFKDVYMRMHAATKAGSLGLGLLLAAVAVENPTPFILLKCVAIIGFIFLTAPIAAAMISRAAYINKTPIWSKTHLDEMEGKYAEDRSELKG
jgi:multicomponent Na+:H+ antiporter subunit G